MDPTHSNGKENFQDDVARGAMRQAQIAVGVWGP